MSKWTNAEELKPWDNKMVLVAVDAPGGKVTESRLAYWDRNVWRHPNAVSVTSIIYAWHELPENYIKPKSCEEKLALVKDKAENSMLDPDTYSPYLTMRDILEVLK